MDDEAAARVRRGFSDDDEDRTDTDGTTPDPDGDDDEVRRLDRELAVANDLAPDANRRDAPGTAPRETP